MAKPKRGKKKSFKKGASTKDLKLLIENNIVLQRIMTDFAGDIKDMSRDIKELLTVFKEASKTFGEEKALEDIEKESLMPKLDTLVDQNKTIAKALILLEAAMKDKSRTRDYSF